MNAFAPRSVCRRLTILRLALPCLAAGALIAAESPNDAPAWFEPTWTPVHDVRLEGNWGRQFTAACTRLHTAPLGDPDYVIADVALDRKRIFTEYSGDISGRMIGMEAFLARSSPAEAATLAALVNGVTRCQKPDGHFGAEQHLPSLNRAFDMPILWGNGRLLIGLTEAYAETGNPAALAAARRLGDYFVATDTVYCRPENLQNVGGGFADAFSTCYFSCIEGLVALARETHDPRYRHQAERIAALAVALPSLGDQHSHGRLTTLRGLVDLAGLTGETRWLTAAENDWRTIFERYRLPTAGVSERLSRGDTRDEGCAVADWLRLNLVLWRATGWRACLDEAERCLKNHFAFQQFMSGGSGHRPYTMVNGEPAAFAGGGTEAYWCCCEHWPRALADVARLVATPVPDGVRINLAVDTEVKLASAGTQWQVKTEETGDGLRVELTPRKPVRATLHLHRPGWANAATVTAPPGVNVVATDDEWRLTGRWTRRALVEIQFHAAVRAERTAAGGVVFLRGHDVLVAHAIPANAWLFQSDGRTLPAVLGPPVFAPGAANGVVTAVDGVGLGHTLELAPMRSRVQAFPHKCWFAFATASPDAAHTVVEAATNTPPLYLTVAATVPCKVWMNGREIGRAAGWQSPLDGFGAQWPANQNTLLVVCDPAPDPARAPGMIVGLSGRTGAPAVWQVRACTTAEAQRDAAALAGMGDWQPAAAFAPARVPSRENASSVLADLPANWITGALSHDRPVLVLRTRW
ncbi:MAG: beta-L-arabinofuranosidase domain-containing protein [Verrucomicrobiota bacterium]|jgi:hypothetical protein